MRVLIATSNLSIVGGIERYVQALIPALLKRGHEVSVLYEHGALPGVETVDMAGTDLVSWCWRDLGQTASGWEKVVQWKPDLVYSQGLQSIQAERTLLDNYPTVWYAHVYLGTCATGRKCHSFPQRRPCHRRFGPMCLVLHYPRRCGGLHPMRALEMYWAHASRNAQFNDYASILVASNAMYREYEQHGVRAGKLRLVPLPITDMSAGDMPPPARPVAAGILFVGRLTDLKGVDYLLRAIPMAAEKLGRRLTLTIAGDGPDRPSLEQLAGRLGVETRFAGWLQSKDKYEAMRQADLLAVPSLWPEPFGMVGMEAGCLGLPAVGFAVGGIPDWLLAGQTGEIAPGDPPTVEGLAAAIVRALADHNHYGRLRRGAFEASRRLNLERHLDQLETVLRAAACHSTPALPAMADITR